MSPDFIAYVSEMLAPVGTVRCKRMFGGVGIYINELFCALIADDALFFKADDLNEAEFIKAGCAPFTYSKEGAEFTMRYYRVPEEAMDNSQEMMQWARLGLDAALRKSATHRPATKKSTKTKATKTSPKRL